MIRITDECLYVDSIYYAPTSYQCTQNKINVISKLHKLYENSDDFRLQPNCCYNYDYLDTNRYYGYDYFILKCLIAKTGDFKVLFLFFSTWFFMLTIN